MRAIPVGQGNGSPDYRTLTGHGLQKSCSRLKRVYEMVTIVKTGELVEVWTTLFEEKIQAVEMIKTPDGFRFVDKPTS